MIDGGNELEPRGIIQNGRVDPENGVRCDCIQDSVSSGSSDWTS